MYFLCALWVSLVQIADHVNKERNIEQTLEFIVCFIFPAKPGYCYSANDRVFVRKGVHVQAPGRCGTLACNGNSVYQSQLLVYPLLLIRRENQQCNKFVIFIISCKIVPPKSGCWVTSGYQNRAFPNCCPLTCCPTTGRQQRYRTSGK